MTDEFRVPDTDAKTIELLLDVWEDMVEQGERPAPEIICRDHPHLLVEFISKTEKLAQVSNQLQPNELTQVSDPDGAPESKPAEEIQWSCDASQLRYHAHGGLGIVYRGFDQQLHRNVAIKFIRERRRYNPVDIQRFRVEAEITSRLDHPGVAPVHGYGKTENGVPFYTMRMVEGQTLQQFIDDYHNSLKKDEKTREHSLDFRKLLSSFISVCNTIEYAHTRGVINCDIKPGNVMLGKYGETVVLDWGCAKYVGSEGKAKSVGEESLKPLSDTGPDSGSGSTGGTPIYMSPEQHAQTEDIGSSSDIYGLGVTLYRLITGRPPFSPENSLSKIRESVIRGKFHKPTDLCPWIPKALEAICLKAMALASEDRYPSAVAMARDLERYLGDEEVIAYPEPLSRRVSRLMRRHRGVSRVLLISAIILILFSTVFAGIMGQLANRESYARQEATQMRNRSLQVAARSAATSMALKINDAWRILEIESNSQHLLEVMSGTGNQNDATQWEDIQQWLVKQAQAQEKATQASSWFLCNAAGVQIARYPLEDDKGELYDSIGSNYSHRDYFHGNGNDLLVGEQGSPSHIEEINLSTVYQSSNTADLKVAFSIPIWSTGNRDGERQFLGVLGYSVELGRFAVLQDEAEGRRMQEISVLVNMRGSRESKNSQYGMILQHPELREMLRKNNPILSDILRLGEEEMKAIEDHRAQRIEQILETGFAAPTTDVQLIENYVDPFDVMTSPLYIAACEPVCVVGRSSKSFNTGWLVIVQGLSSD